MTIQTISFAEYRKIDALNYSSVKKLLVSEREIVGLTLDPMMETADADIENNFYPRRMVPSRIESFKRSASSSRVARDIMQDIKTELKTDDEASDEE